MEGTIPINMEGTPPLRGVPYPTLNHTGLEGTRPPTGASPTQPYKCSQNVKIKTALTLTLTLILKY